MRHFSLHSAVKQAMLVLGNPDGLRGADFVGPRRSDELTL
jgi:hypothetical protein